jgi:hypothetical protein
MTILANLRNKQFYISRLTTISGNKRAYSTTTGVLAEIQPLSPSKTQAIEGVMGKTYVVYAGATDDILEADRLREVSTNKIYKVKTGGVQRRTQGSFDFLVVYVEQVT